MHHFFSESVGFLFDSLENVVHKLVCRAALADKLRLIACEGTSVVDVGVQEFVQVSLDHAVEFVTKHL